MRVFNPTPSPVVVDDEGHTVPGGEWGDADPNFAGTQSAVHSGVLLAADGPQEANPAAAEPPPLTGRGSSREAWAAYADGKVTVTNDMTRDDIVAALRAADVPVGDEE